MGIIPISIRFPPDRSGYKRHPVKVFSCPSASKMRFEKTLTVSHFYPILSSENLIKIGIR
jgi:hypothetical protein